MQIFSAQYKYSECLNKLSRAMQFHYSQQSNKHELVLNGLHPDDRNKLRFTLNDHKDQYQDQFLY